MEGFLKEVTKKGLIRRTSTIRPFGDLENIPGGVGNVPGDKDFFDGPRVVESDTEGMLCVCVCVCVSVRVYVCIVHHSESSHTTAPRM
jgi:hypothetical protein